MVSPKPKSLSGLARNSCNARRVSISPSRIARSQWSSKAVACSGSRLIVARRPSNSTVTPLNVWPNTSYNSRARRLRSRLIVNCSTVEACWANLSTLAASAPAAENRGVQAGLPQTSQLGGRLFIRLSAGKWAAGIPLHRSPQAPLTGSIRRLGWQSQTGSAEVGWNSSQATSAIPEVSLTANIILPKMGE